MWSSKRKKQNKKQSQIVLNLCVEDGITYFQEITVIQMKKDLCNNEK